MNILALDTATVTGWATATASGVQDFSLARGESPGMRFIKLRGWLKKMQELDGPYDMIVIEQAHHRGGAPTMIGVGLVTHVLGFAAEHKIEVMPVHTATLKKWATGHGKAGKPAMIEAARRRGYNPQDDNEADAILLLAYAVEQVGG